MVSHVLPPGKTYRLRVINVSGQIPFRFYIEGHGMTIISISGGDVAPIYIPPKKPDQPFFQNGIELQPAERYDILIKADQPKGVYFIRTDRWVRSC